MNRCIVWGNTGESILAADETNMIVTTSCIQGPDVFPGEGNINEDPLFCGWSEGDEEVEVTSVEELEAALVAGEFSLAIQPESPCFPLSIGASYRL